MHSLSPARFRETFKSELLGGVRAQTKAAPAAPLSLVAIC